MSDLEVMNEMAKQNLDIAMFPDLIKADKAKGGGHITFGVPAAPFTTIVNQMFTGNATHYVVVYVINKEQFNQIKDNATP